MGISEIEDILERKCYQTLQLCIPNPRLMISIVFIMYSTISLLTDFYLTIIFYRNSDNSLFKALTTIAIAYGFITLINDYLKICNLTSFYTFFDEALEFSRFVAASQKNLVDISDSFKQTRSIMFSYSQDYPIAAIRVISVYRNVTILDYIGLATTVIGMFRIPVGMVTVAFKTFFRLAYLTLKNRSYFYGIQFTIYGFLWVFQGLTALFLIILLIISGWNELVINTKLENLIHVSLGFFGYLLFTSTFTTLLLAFDCLKMRQTLRNAISQGLWPPKNENKGDTPQPTSTMQLP